MGAYDDIFAEGNAGEWEQRSDAYRTNMPKAAGETLTLLNQELQGETDPGNIAALQREIARAQKVAGPASAPAPAQTPAAAPARGAYDDLFEESAAPASSAAPRASMQMPSLSDAETGMQSTATLPVSTGNTANLPGSVMNGLPAVQRDALSGVSVGYQNSIRARLGAGTPEQRQAMLAAPGLAGRVAQAIDGTMQRESGTIGAISGPQATVGSVASGLAQVLPQAGRAVREGIRSQFADAAGFDAMAEDAKRKYAGVELERAINTPEFESDTARAIYSGVDSALRMAPGLAASIATRSPTPALAAMGAMTEAEAYAKYRGRGATPGMALVGGIGEGATEVATELLPMSFLVSKLGKAGFSEFMRGMLARELPSEQIATIVQDAIDTAIANPDKSWADYAAERPGAAYQTLVATLTQSAIMGGLNTAAGRMQPSRDQQIAREIQDSVDNTEFTEQGIDTAARAALSPDNAQLQQQPMQQPQADPVEEADRLRAEQQAVDRADLTAVLNDPRQMAEIQAEREQQAAQQAAQEESARQQAQADQQAKVSAVAEQFGMPAPGQRTIATLPTGETVAGSVVTVADENGTPVIQLRDDEGNEYALGPQDAQFRPEPIGTGQQGAPVVVERTEDIAIAERQVDTSPTEAQKAQGNYAMGHVKLQGLDITIENPAGSTRTGVDKNGKPWSSQIMHTYGYIKGSTAKDGDHIDVFLGPQAADGQSVFVVDQIDPDTGRYDEAKALVGFADGQTALEGYLSNYEAGWRGAGAMTEMSMPELKAWLAKGNTKKPLRYKQQKAQPAPVQSTSEARDGRQENRTSRAQDPVSGAQARPAPDGQGAAPVAEAGPEPVFIGYSGKNIGSKSKLTLERMPDGQYRLLQDGYPMEDYDTGEDVILSGTPQEIAENIRANMEDLFGKGRKFFGPDASKAGKKESAKPVEIGKKLEDYSDAQLDQAFKNTRNAAARAQIEAEKARRKQNTPAATQTQKDANASTPQPTIPAADAVPPAPADVGRADAASAAARAGNAQAKAPDPAEPSRPAPDEVGGQAVFNTRADANAAMLEAAIATDRVHEVIERADGRFEVRAASIEDLLASADPDVLDAIADAYDDVTLSPENVSDEAIDTYFDDEAEGRPASEVAPLEAESGSDRGDQAAPEVDIVDVKDVYGRTHRVRQIDLDGEMERIPTIRKNGDIISGEEIPRSIIKQAPPAAPEVSAQPETPVIPPDVKTGLEASIADRISKAEADGIVLSAADKAEIKAVLEKAAELRKQADRKGISDPMNKGNAFPLGVGFTKMTRRKEQAMDSSVRRAGEAVEIYKRAEAAENFADDLLAGKGTQDSNAKKAAAQEAAQRALVQKLGNWKKGDKVGSFTIERVNKNRDGYPATYTISGDGIVKGVMDKVDVVREIFKGDEAKFRAMVDEARATRQEQAEAPTATVDGPITLAAHETAIDAARAGTISLDDFKATYQRIIDNEVALKAEMNGRKKDDLLSAGGPMFGYRHKSERKDQIIDHLYNNMLQEFALGSDKGISYTIGAGFDSYEKSRRAAVDKAVQALTEQDLKTFAEKVGAAREEAQAKRAQRTAGMADPQTLDDYRALVREKMDGGMNFTDARLSLDPEQRARFDELTAEATRGERLSKKAEDKAEVRVAGQLVDGGIIETKHTAKGHDLFVVQLAERVPREDYDTLNTAAKKMGGYYSSFRGRGAVAGFQFKDKPTAEAFVKLAQGDKEAAQEAVNVRRDAFADDRSQSAAERLTEMAEAMESRADASSAVERKANTSRRARFAASAEAAASHQRAMAATMHKIAESITGGKAKFLDRVRQKVQIELLDTLASNARHNALRADPAFEKLPYDQREARRTAPPTVADMDHAEWPQYTAFRSDLARMGRQMLEHDGFKKMGQQILKVADDVSTAYIKFAKENIEKVSTFATKDGARAAFQTKDMAQTAIERSGYRGQAIVLPVKRGENAIILSPAEARKRGIWEGDDDAKITLKAEFGAELADKLGRLNRYRSKVDMPWAFETAHQRRKVFTRMGIETPAEMRAAMREYMALREQPAETDKVKQLERAMIGRRKDGLDFFPTPAEAADEMVATADIQEGMSVLEPSAGMGHIADRIRAAGVDPDVIELSNERRELLEAKGYNVIASDFMDINPREFFTYGDTFKDQDGNEGIMRGTGGLGSGRVGLVVDGVRTWRDREELTGVKKNGIDSGYDRIIMNPPFSDRRDVAHVKHAYSLLKPGGRLVAIMGEGSFFGQDKKAQEFRSWLEEVGGTDEKLADGTFMNPSLPVNTGVSARMVVIDKPGGKEESPTDTEDVADDVLGDVGQSSTSPQRTFDASLYAAVESGSSAAEVLTRIAAESKSANNRELAQALLDASINPKIEIGRAQDNTFTVKDIPDGFAIAAGYSPKLDAVLLFTPRVREKNLVHEFVHAGTYQALRKGGPNAIQMKRLYQHVKNDGGASGAYGMSNFDEFTAEALSNPEFQDKLRAITAMPEGSKFANAWDWFVDLVRRMLNLPAKASTVTALDQALRYGRGLMGESRADGQSDSDVLPNVDTDTDAFRRWFGDSKVVDEGGKPLTVYHGKSTRQEFVKPKRDAERAKKEAAIWAEYRAATDPIFNDPAYSHNNEETAAIVDAAMKKRASELAAIGPVDRGIFINMGADLDGGTFDPERTGDIGIHFGTREQASQFGNDGAVFPVYLSAKNIIRVPDIFSRSGEYLYAVDELVSANIVDPTKLARIRPLAKKLEKAYLAAEEAGLDPRDIGTSADHISFWRQIRAAVRPNIDGLVYANEIEGTGDSYVVFRSSQIKSAIGNSGAFDPNDDSILGDIAADQDSAAAAPAERAERAGFDIPRHTGLRQTQERVQDRMNRLKVIIKAVAEQDGTVTDENNFYKAEERYHGRVSARLDDFMDEVEQFIADAKTADIALDQIALYAYAKHAPSRNRAARAINPEVTTGSGMSDEAAAQIIADAKTGTAPLATRLAKMSERTLEIQVRAGLITTEQANRLKEKWDFYVPLRGFETIDEDGKTVRGRGIGQGLDIRGKEFKQALGRDSRAGQVIENIILDRERALVRSEKNEILKRFLLFVRDNPDANLWEIDKKRSKIVSVSEERQLTRLLKDLEIDRRDLSESQIADLKETHGITGATTNKVTINENEQTIGLKVAGKPVYISIKDKTLFEQLKRLNEDSVPEALAIVGAFNRFLARSYTAWSPVFALMTNPIRDAQTALIGMTGEAGIKGPVLWAKNWPKAVTAAFQYEALGKRNALYDEYRNMGGKTGFYDLKSLPDKMRELQVLWEDATKQPTEGKEWRYYGRKLAKPLLVFEDVISRLAGTFENASRLAAYQSMKDVGQSKEQAASVAKNLTVNFNRRGTWGPALSSWFLFYNPAVQGTARIHEVLFQTKHKKEVWAVLGLGMAAIAALTMMNADAGEDDDEIPWWDKIPQHEKDRNLIIVLPPYMKEIGEAIPNSKTGRYLKLPMPYGYNIFPRAAQLMTDVVRNQRDGAHGLKSGAAAAELLKSFIASYNPVGGERPFEQTIAGPFGMVVQHTTNVSSFGSPLYPEMDFDKGLPDSEKYSVRDKGGPYQRWAAFVNQATGGTKYEEGGISVPPGVWRNYWRGITGGIGSFFGDMADSYGTSDITRAPFVRQAFGEIGVRNDASLYYEISEKAEEAHATAMRARDAKDGDIAMEMARTNPLVRLGVLVDGSRGRLSQLRKEEMAVIDSKVYAQAEKDRRRKLIEQNRGKVFQDFLSTWRKEIRKGEQ